MDPIRSSILLALGLLGACGDSGDSTAGTASGSEGTGASSGTGDTTLMMTSASASDSDATTAATASASATTSSSTTTGLTTGTGTDTSAGTDTGASATDGTSTGTSSTTDVTTTASSDTTDGTTGPDPECVPLMQGFTDPPVPSGWVQCGDQLPHRVSQETCVVPAAPTNCGLDDPNAQCKTNADCTEQPFGSCQQTSLGLITCACFYGCETDADCEAGSVCRCGGDVLGPTSRCVSSSCVDDSECGDEVCQFALSEGDDCPLEVVGGACTTPNDQCASDLTCGDVPCTYDGGKWACSGLICGRPFVVDDRAVTADAAGRDDWGAAILVAAAPEALRGPLAAHWTWIALAEHASIASFARFILQLLAVGAPAELVVRAQEALADECEHARVCFALAGRHGGADVGPGPLPHADAPAARDLEAIVAAVIREACVGETLSALEVREAAARAEDPGLRRLLTKIADDEQRHAELGWRVVGWALARLDDAGRARAHAVLVDAVAEAEAAAHRLSQETGHPELRAHGVVDGPLRAAVHLQGLCGLVMPIAAALQAA